MTQTNAPTETDEPTIEEKFLDFLATHGGRLDFNLTQISNRSRIGFAQLGDLLQTLKETGAIKLTNGEIVLNQ